MDDLNRISVRFSEPVTVVKDDLLLRGVSAPGGAVDLSGATFSYNAAAWTATWTLASGTFLGNDKLLLHLRNTVYDADLNELDGDWTDTVSAFPSGNGASGGLFQFRVNILPGDGNQNGAVNSIDLSTVKSKVNTTTTSPTNGTGGTYSPYYDVDGNGRINALDQSAVQSSLNTSLPDAEPIKPMLPAAPTGFSGTVPRWWTTGFSIAATA